MRGRVWLGLGLSIITMSSWADTALNFSGVVTAPMPCTINGKQKIETNFGADLVTTYIDGVHYLKTLSYTLECRNNSSNALKIKVQGDPADFNPQALQTNIADLGIELRINGQPLTINAWANFNYLAKPLLQAVPVRRANSNLPAGTFSVNAIMLVDYQ